MENKEIGEVPSLTPFPANFAAVFAVSSEELRSLTTLKPFTPEWAVFWAGLADKYGNRNFFDKLLKSFDDGGALENLQAVATKGADPNLLLLLFVKYLWMDENAVPTYERKEPIVANNQELLQAVRKVHLLYDEFYNKPSLPAFAYRKDLILSGEPSSEVERFLTEAEQKLSDFLKSRDYPQAMRSPPKDKINRVIFAIHHHLKEKTGGPQWSDFLELLVAANAVERGKKKKKTAEEVLDDSPASHVSSRIKSFQKYHAGEAKAIAMLMARPLSQLLSVPPPRQP